MPSPYVINDNGAWCWFQDERALVDPDAGVLVVGSIAAPEGPGGDARAGNVELTVVDLATRESRVVVLHENLEADDHDVPALWRRRDGRWLAVYAKHKTDDMLRRRISEPGDPTRWGPESTFDWSELTEGRGVTYANLHELDGRLYCFTRAINDDQCALVSDDDGDTWTFAGKLFTRPKVGYVNGYTRYASTRDRIDLVTTDHHPRDYDNAIYHGYLERGMLHRSDGSVLDPRALDGGAPSQEGLTRILAAGTVLGGATLTHAWTSDIRVAPDGSIAATLTARGDDRPASVDEEYERMREIRDLRFVYARFHPDRGWAVHPLAPAGPGLLPHEQDYTGLAAIDPDDLDTVYVSTPIDPRDGSVTAHREIYRGRTPDSGASWRWTAITSGSDADNLRPIVAPGDPTRTALLWFRGDMTASQHYRCEIVLLDEPR
ncbi:BNR-4 repeat-containing protein [Microbacterium kyungheense]|uniref:Putative BNR repeat neuraminidase n=1 Tax=Microbacterium kyungheense TaxID=1263636 RepID=A0A543FJX8_9MICO|nr:BNR-4 repeat-containing protein [Microbacterium kyungheense]TQM34189.1 putative BNR repeat neuraminidase [Microbacterium kyungheense]